MAKEKENRMNRLGWMGALTAGFLLCLFDSAHATIDKIEGTLGCRNGCSRTTVQKVAQGERFTIRVIGPWVDTASWVRTDFGHSIVSRKGGLGSYIDIDFDVGQTFMGPRYDPGERTVELHYPIELNGYDSFKLRVVKRGTISSIMYKQPRYETQTVVAGARKPMVTKQVVVGYDAVPPVNLPLNQPVMLLISGTGLMGVQVKHPTGARSVTFLEGGTSTQREFQFDFSQSGEGDLQIFDSQLSDTDMIEPDAHKFVYTGQSRRIQYGGPFSTALPQDRPTLGSISPGPQFIDVAPRTITDNLFRPLSANPEFTNTSGTQFFRVDGQHCGTIGGLEGFATITVPNPIWGVVNVGTLPVTTAFASQLKSGNQVLGTGNATALNLGQETRFTFVRPNSEANGTPVKVTKLNAAPHIGCFISPQLRPFFQDPPLTVIVNTNGGAGELPDHQVNNSRTF
jgi:hypothetical protein